MHTCIGSTYKVCIKRAIESREGQSTDQHHQTAKTGASKAEVRGQTSQEDQQAKAERQHTDEKPSASRNGSLIVGQLENTGDGQESGRKALRRKAAGKHS